MSSSAASEPDDQPVPRVRGGSKGRKRVGAVASKTPTQLRPRRDQRIEVRATREQARLIGRAAALRESTVTQFVLDAVVVRAEEVIREDRTLMLPNAVFDQFMAILDGDAGEVPELVELFQRTDSPLPPA